MSEHFAHGYAMLIGVDHNSVAKWALTDVAKDIQALAGVLSHPDRCAYIPNNVRMVTGVGATRQGILDGLEWLRDRIRNDNSDNVTAVLYYSGHGWCDASVDPSPFYFVPYDVREDRVRSSALRAEDFAEIVAGLKPKRLLVVLDCCHAAGMGVKELSAPPAGYRTVAATPLVFLEGAETVAGPSAKGFEMLTQGRGRAVLSSSSAEQRSYMRSDGKMSIFTYHLIEALTGHAEPREGAAEVLVSDVMSYVWRRVPQSAMAQCGAVQEPDYQVSGNFPIALLLGGKGLGKGEMPPDPLDALPGEKAKMDWGSIDTGGGAFAGRDQQIIHGDQIYGDKVTGDKVIGDKITVGNISRSAGIAVGRDAQATVTQGVSGNELRMLFEAVYREIKARPEHADVDKTELTDIVRRIMEEAAKGEQANPNKVERWLQFLAGMAPDILQVTAACLRNPVAGVATVIRKVAEKVAGAVS